MKTKLSAVLFAICVSACGGDREMPKNTPSITSFVEAGKTDNIQVDTLPASDATPAPQPVQTAPIADEHPIPTKFEDALAEGRKLAEKGDQSRAKEMFEAAIKLDKRRGEPHMELARLYIASGDKGLAAYEAKKAVKLAPASSQAWNTLGRADLNRFAYDEAITDFTKSVELNRDNVWAWNNLGYTELLLKKYDDAVEHLTEATSRKGATGYMWNNLGTAYEQMDRLDEARTAFDEGGKLGSKEAVASRARLEGVKSIAMAKMEKEDKVDVKPGYELNEGQLDVDQNPQPEDGNGSGSGSGSDIGNDTETH